MPRKRPLVAITKLQSWETDQLRDLQWFLSEQEKMARKAVKNMLLASTLEDEEWIRNNLTYWRHAVGTIRWLTANVQRTIDAREGKGGHGRHADSGHN